MGVNGVREIGAIYKGGGGDEGRIERKKIVKKMDAK
jgi:hypothetical protein